MYKGAGSREESEDCGLTRTMMIHHHDTAATDFTMMCPLQSGHKTFHTSISWVIMSNSEPPATHDGFRSKTSTTLSQFPSSPRPINSHPARIRLVPSYRPRRIYPLPSSLQHPARFILDLLQDGMWVPWWGFCSVVVLSVEVGHDQYG